MFKKTKLYIGVAFIVQSVSCLVAFFILCKKEKSVAKAFLAVAAVGGIAGAAMLYLNAKDELKRRKIAAASDACCADDGSDYFDEYEDLDEIGSCDDVSDLCALDGTDEMPF